MKKKLFLLMSLVVIFAMVFPAQAAPGPQTLLPSSALPQFIQPLPLLSAAGGPMQTVFGFDNQPDPSVSMAVHMCEFKARVLPLGFVPQYSGTWVWGYLPDPDPTGASTCAQLIDEYDDPNNPGLLGTYIGPVILAQRNVPTEVKWINDLGNTKDTQVLAYKYSTDQTLHWADPLNSGGDNENMCNHMAKFPDYLSPCSLNYGEDPNNPGTFTQEPIPAAVHLHGGEVPPQIDGGPDAWYTSDGAYIGGGYYSKDGVSNKNYAIYNYPNTQEASPIWFHDHTLGATRLNVFSGLAGAYLIADPNLVLPSGLGDYGLERTTSGGDELTVPLVIQDRSFDTDGQLFMPADSAGGVLWTTNPEHPYWVPEFVGDTILVNGVAWPFMNVEPKRYRFLFLNGSNARTYSMFLTDPVSKNFGPPIYLIASDGGYLDTPVLIDPAAAGLNKLTMMPGERYEAIIDFNGYEAGTIGPNGVAYSGQWLLKNNAKTPFPAGETPQGATTARIMLFRVGTCPTGGECGAADTSYNPAGGAAIRTGSDQIARLVDPVAGTLAPGVTNQVNRQLTLNEVMGMPMNVTDPVTGLPTAYPGGPLEILVNNTKWSGERITGVDNGTYTHVPITGAEYTDGTGDYLTELPQEGNTEIWEIVNLTADAHPIHLHLVQFQLMNRQNFNVNKYTAAYNAAFTDPSGYDFTTGQPCAIGVFCPGYGPPLPFDGSDPLSNGKIGGNPDVGAVSPKNGKLLYLQGMPTPPNPNEVGWKDTVIMYPGQVTRIAVRWAPTSLPNTTSPMDAYYPFDPSGGFSGGTEFPYGYVWHCHIIDHEDNEMMRPDAVFPNSNASRSFTDY